MAVTDLTGYTWTGNDTLNSLGAQLDATFNINFTCNEAEYQQFIFINTLDDVFDYELRYDSTKIYSYFFDGWEDTSYKVVKFINGDDVTNSSLINWLEENGTLTPSVSGDTIKFCEDVVDDVKLGELQVDKLYLGETLIWSK